jgi:hypothetical protein
MQIENINFIKVLVQTFFLRHELLIRKSEKRF